MSDLFHVHVPEPYVRKIFQVMLRADWHVYQVLTKRPARALRFWRRHPDLFPNGSIPAHIWMGTSIEDQSVVFRLDQLRSVPARVRFVSCEPLIGELDLDLDDVHWVIVGGESGRVRRPMGLDWVRRIRDDCVSAGVPFFFKQIGGRTPKAGGRLLDGRTWDQYPSISAFARPLD